MPCTQSGNGCAPDNKERLYYENATHQFELSQKRKKINFTKAQEKDIQKRMA